MTISRLLLVQLDPEHIFTHLKRVSGRHRSRRLSDGMVEHDGTSEQLLNKLDELGSPTTPSSCTRR